MAYDKRFNWDKEGITIEANTRQAKRVNDERPFHYGEHRLKKGEISKLIEYNGNKFPAIDNISCERLVELGVCDIIFNPEKTKYLYIITRDCIVDIQHEGVEQYVRKGKIETRNKTTYQLMDTF